MKNSTILMIQSNGPCAPHLADPEVKFKAHDSVARVQSEQVYAAPNSALMRIALNHICCRKGNTFRTALFLSHSMPRSPKSHCGGKWLRVSSSSR